MHPTLLTILSSTTIDLRLEPQPIHTRKDTVKERVSESGEYKVSTVSILDSLSHRS